MIHLYYVSSASTVRDFQELSNAVRTATMIRMAFTYNAPRALVLRGTGNEISLADWLVSELDDPANAKSPAPQAYRIALNSSDAARFGDVVRVFYLSAATTVQDFQEIANLVRTAATIRSAFTYSTPRALTLRGTDDQIALAAWLIHELNTNGQDEYRVPNTSDEVVRVFYLPHTTTVQDFQDAANTIRTTTNIRTALTYNAQRALALRGTATQLALAERLVTDLDPLK